MGLKRLEELLAEQSIIKTRLAEIADLPDPEGDEVARSKALTERDTETDDLLARWDALEVERGPLVERANRLDAVRAAAVDIARTEGGDGARYLGGRGPGFNKQVDPFDTAPAELSRAEAIDRARRVFDGEKRVPVSDSNKARLEGMVLRSGETEVDGGQFDGSYVARRALYTENPLYRAAFQKYVRLGAAAMFSAEEQRAVAQFQDFEIRRAASENTTTAGGFGIPVMIDPTIIITSGAADVPLLRVCRTETVTNNLWKGVSSAGMTWSYDTEAAEVSDDTPVLAQPTVTVHMARGHIPYSIEVGQDYPGFAAQMSRLIDQGYSDLLAAKTMVGSGTGEPFGVFTALDASTWDEVVTTTDGQFGGEDIFKVWNALPERYRGRATWIMSVHVQSAIRKFAAATTTGSAYFTIDLTGGQFKLNDRPVIVTDYAPTFSGAVPGTTGAANVLAVGAWDDAYLWVQRAGMSVEQIPMLFATGNNLPSGQRALFAWARNGGNVVANNAARLLQNQ